MKGFNVAENGKIIRFLVVVTIEQMLMYLVVTVSREAGVQGSLAHKQENKTKGRPLTKERDDDVAVTDSIDFVMYGRVRA